MRWTDLLRMSAGNLRRRKLRTFLTVLGVIIGTTSIVVMISLGMGMQKSIYDEIDQMGGLTTITVMPPDDDVYMSYTDSAAGAAGKEEPKYLTDGTVEELKKLDHAKSVWPTLSVSAMLIKGQYEAYGELKAVPPEGFAALDIPLREGSRLPATGTGTLELLYGNNIITNFYKKDGSDDYYMTGELPDIDLEKDTVFLILDQDRYYQTLYPEEGFYEEGAAGTAAAPVKKYAVKASGLVAGDVETYNAFSYDIYCDLDTMKRCLKKEFAGRAIPGQPVSKSGKPLKEFCYSNIMVKADDLDHVEELSAQIREMGYQIYTEAEYLDSMQQEMAVVQAVLGGIGAISLLVAAIGITNTMMMAIYERTKEIGIMKVLGCSLKNIRQMFLMEAAFIGLIGGAVGCAFSYLLSKIINMAAAGMDMVGEGGSISYIPLWLAAAAVIFAVFVGMAAGYFPARRAMKLSPLAAIRGE